MAVNNDVLLITGLVVFAIGFVLFLAKVAQYQYIRARVNMEAELYRIIEEDHVGSMLACERLEQVRLNALAKVPYILGSSIPPINYVIEYELDAMRVSFDKLRTRIVRIREAEYAIRDKQFRMLVVSSPLYTVEDVKAILDSTKNEHLRTSARLNEVWQFCYMLQHRSVEIHWFGEQAHNIDTDILHCYIDGISKGKITGGAL